MDSKERTKQEVCTRAKNLSRYREKEGIWETIRNRIEYIGVMWRDQGNPALGGCTNRICLTDKKRLSKLGAANNGNLTGRWMGTEFKPVAVCNDGSSILGDCPVLFLRGKILDPGTEINVPKKQGNGRKNS